MAMVVRSNLAAVNSNRQLGMNNSAVSKSLEKLSSGFRINRASDDASGLAISEKMKAQIKGLDQAASNAQDGISLVQTAEGAMTEVHNMLNRMVELATKSANGTIADKVDREAIQSEVDQLISEIDRIGDATNFNGINLLDGSLGAGGAPKVEITTAGATMTKADAVAYKGSIAVGTASLTHLQMKFKDAAGNDKTVTVSAAAGASAASTARALVDLLNADGDFSGTFNATLSGTNVVVTANTPGAMPASAVKANITSAAADATADIPGAVSGMNESQKITLPTAMTAGDKITIGGKTYEMAAAADTAAGKFATVDDLISLAAADGYTVTGAITAGGTLTIASAETTGGLTLQVGDTNDAFNKVTVSVDDVRAGGLNITGLKVNTEDAAGNSIRTIKDAINKVSTNRGNLGAIQNRLEYAINNLNVTSENMTSANSRIRDTDMAKEMMEYTKMNVLTQSAQAMLAQSNQQPQSILQLLQ